MVGCLCFSFSIAERGQVYCFNVVIAVTTCSSYSRSSGSSKDILMPYPTSNLFSLTLYFLINNNSIERYIDTLNLYLHGIFFRQYRVDLPISNYVPAVVLDCLVKVGIRLRTKEKNH
jgi:hypothetical protein